MPLKQADKPRHAGRNAGDIVLELDPRSTRSPSKTLQYVRDGHYDGTIFHR